MGCGAAGAGSELVLRPRCGAESDGHPGPSWGAAKRSRDLSIACEVSVPRIDLRDKFGGHARRIGATEVRRMEVAHGRTLLVEWSVDVFARDEPEAAR